MTSFDKISYKLKKKNNCFKIEQNKSDQEICNCNLIISSK